MIEASDSVIIYINKIKLAESEKPEQSRNHSKF